MERARPGEKRILIVDDDEDVLGLVQATLDREGFKTVTAMDGRSGMAWVAREKPDLIVLDLMLPGKGGYEVVRELQQDSDLRKIPIVIITARTVDESTRDMIKSEVNVIDIFDKPIRPAIFIEDIHRILKTISRAELNIEERRRAMEDRIKKQGPPTTEGY